jgi:hypothetical protein
MVEKTRALAFLEAPKMQPVSAPELQAHLLAVIMQQHPPAQAELWQRAHEALGFRWQPRVPFVEALAELMLERDGGCYHPATRTLYFNPAAADPAPSRLQQRLLNFLTRILLEQHFPSLTATTPLGTPNDDAAKALAALAMGDAQFTALRCLLLQADTQPPAARPEEQPPAYGGAPRFFKELVQFPVAYGGALLDSLPGKPSGPALNPHYLSPPASTSAIMHPAPPALPPETLELPPGPPATAPPAYENSLGEFGMRVLFRSLLTHDAAQQASAGWRGDRYQFWPGHAGSAGDQLLWKSVWASLADAQEFSDAMAQTFLTQQAILAEPGQTPSPGNYRITGPNRALSIRCDPASRSVVVLNCGSGADLDAFAEPRK